MSAYIVNKKTIDRIITALAFGVGEMPRLEYFPDLVELIGDKTPSALCKAGEKLYRMNVAAVNYRYSERNTLPPYRFQYEYANRVQTLKSIQCYTYQCAEGNVPKRKLYKALSDYSCSLALKIVDGMQEYDEAEWG